MTITTAVIIAAACYLAGGIARGLAIIGMCLLAIFFFKHLGTLELLLAGAAIFFAHSKGYLQLAFDRATEWLKTPTPPEDPPNE